MSTITELRELLFDAIRGVKDGTLELDRAKAVSELSQTVINSAKAETDFMRASGRVAVSDFIPSDRQRRVRGPDALELPPPGDSSPATGQEDDKTYVAKAPLAPRV